MWWFIRIILFFLTSSLAVGCPNSEVTDSQLLKDSSALRKIFARYAPSSQVLTSGALQKLLHDLEHMVGQAPSNLTLGQPADEVWPATVSETRKDDTKHACQDLESILLEENYTREDTISPSTFLSLCPVILWHLRQCQVTDDGMDGAIVHESHEHSHDHSHGHSHNFSHGESDTVHMALENWIAAITSMIVIGLVGLVCIMLMPYLRKSPHYDVINQFLISLAVGTLSGDALIHLLPHALTSPSYSTMDIHLQHGLYGFTALSGVLIFMFIERLHNHLGGHSHDHHKSSPALGPVSLEREMNNLASSKEESSLTGKSELTTISQHSRSEPKGCFDSCSNEIGASNDANGNNGRDSGAPKCDITTGAESEKLMSNNISTEKDGVVTTLTSSLPFPMVRQNSANFHLVLQEYHVGHHGHTHHGHSHVAGKKDSLRTMILLGDAMHTFLDGLAIGAAYGTSLTGGVATAIAVLFHELPHKVGDFALLFEMGMKRNTALKLLFLLWVMAFVGLVLGCYLGSFQTASLWIYAFTAGVFIYLALVDMLSELSIKHGDTCNVLGRMVIQFVGMVSGAAIMLLIAVFEHDLERLFEQAFSTAI